MNKGRGRGGDLHVREGDAEGVCTENNTPVNGVMHIRTMYFPMKEYGRVVVFLSSLSCH